MSKSEKPVTVRFTAEQIAASAEKKLGETLKKVFEAEAEKWADIKRSDNPWWRQNQLFPDPGQIRGRTFDRVVVDEQSPMPPYNPIPDYRERLIVPQRRYTEEDEILRRMYEMSDRIRYLQERVDLLEAQVETLLMRTKKRPEAPEKKPRAYGNR